MNTLKDFYYFYKEIPEEKWCTGDFKNKKGQCCALGHLGETWDFDTKESNVIKKLTSGWDLVEANNKGSETYKQPTPKQRVLAFLIDKIKEKEDLVFNG